MHLRSGGFSRLELLVVVGVIALLTVVTVPEFGQSASDARLDQLDVRLFELRHAIADYRRDHAGALPGVAATHSRGGSAAPHASAEQAFVLQLMRPSDLAGNTAEEPSAAFAFGPYLRPGLPQSPVAGEQPAGRAASVGVVAQPPPLRAQPGLQAAWLYSSVTGQLIANHPAYQER